MKKILFNPLFFIVGCIFLLCFQRQVADAACRSYSNTIHNGSYAVAGADGELVSSCNPDRAFIPASIIKIQTALAAMHLLGRDFRFQTDFYRDRDNNLFIKGYGDPFLTSEEVESILQHLNQLGVEQINNIVLDVTSFELNRQVPGRGMSDNPYDSPAGAMGVNFNTVKIRVDNQGRVASDEPQTPDLPLMKELGRGLKTGSYRLNICQGGCRPRETTARYAGELFRGMQKRLGIRGEGAIKISTIPVQVELIYSHRNSKNLEDLVFSFLKYSNNYLANQVFLTCGAKQYGFPATWEKAEKAVREALNEILGDQALALNVMEEGSGLSRQNRTTARIMIQTLMAFKQYAHLLQEKKGASIKSGTLKGVYNYAGYLSGGKPFVILLNQESNTRDIILRHLDKFSGESDK